MSARATAATLALVLVAAPAHAEEVGLDGTTEGSSLAYGSRLMIGGGATFGEGTRPTWADPATSYALREYALHLRGALPFWAANPLGSAFAVEWSGVALLSGESPAVATGETTKIEGRAAVGVGGRAFELGGESARLGLVLHANVEASVGGQHWWSSSPRLAPMAGPRVLVSLWGDVAAELDYAFVPDYLTSSPDGMRVNRWEHRATATLAYDSLGVGARYLLASERTRTPLPEIARSHASSVFLFLEWRVAP